MRRDVLAHLVWKETRQLARNRMALLTAALLPFIILFLAPIQLVIQLRLAGSAFAAMQGAPLSGLAGLDDPMQIVAQIIYPMLLVVGGLLLPSITTTYAIVAERERRSLELLIALPVSVSEILVAKLLSVLLLSLLIGLPYFAIVMTLLIVIDVATLATIPALLYPFLGALACSIGFALIITLLARDFRTANNLNGVLLVPVIAITAITLFAVGGPARTYALGTVLLVAAAVTTFIAIRWISFERYLE
jgi:ABC-2 type transport system permease protein